MNEWRDRKKALLKVSKRAMFSFYFHSAQINLLQLGCSSVRFILEHFWPCWTANFSIFLSHSCSKYIHRDSKGFLTLQKYQTSLKKQYSGVIVRLRLPSPGSWPNHTFQHKNHPYLRSTNSLSSFPVCFLITHSSPALVSSLKPQVFASL